MKQSKSSTAQATGANMRRNGLPERKPSGVPLFESLEQRLLLSAVPFADDLSDAYAFDAFSTAVEHGQSVRDQVAALAAKHAAGELKPGEDMVVTEFGEVYYDPIHDYALEGEDMGVQESPVSEGELPATPGAASFDLADTFFLHSNPGSTKTMYLDFNGHTSTVWGGATPAYNFEGTTSTFSDNELTRIQAIWERVVEDFIGFDFNITTEEPPTDWLEKDRDDPDDEHWGVRAVIGGSGAWYGSAGGVAQTGSFTHIYDMPCYVFSNVLSGGAEKHVAEVLSHELGHTVGLGHDGKTGGTEYYAGHGSGETSWAPIMGQSASKNVTQWSKGEYSGANNTMDDLARMTGNYGPGFGFGYLPDDHANDELTATALNIDAYGAPFDSGIIEQTDDVDFFEFTTYAGTINLNIDPFYRGPNLDIQAKLYDSGMTLLASGDQTGKLAAIISETVSAGTYYLSVEGTGSSNYSDYASLGQYTITGNIILPGGTITEMAGETLVSEGDLTDTYDFALNTTPAGSVEITATADSQTEISLDGTNFSSSVVFSRSDTTAQTITVRAINDAAAEGMHTSTISHAITATADTTDYPTSMAISDAVVSIIDDDVDLIVDNLDTNVTIVGSWGANANKPGFYGTDYHHDENDGKGSKSFTFNAPLPNTGTYEVFMQWSAFSNRATNVPVDIIHDGGTTTVTVDQTANGDQFNSLGTYTFTAGTGSVEIRTTSTDGFVIADAVKFVPPAGPTVNISETSGSTDVTEDGATDTYDIALSDTPSASVTVTVTADADSEVSLDGTNFASSQDLTFTTTTAQTVTVRAIDDALDEGSHTATLTHAITATNDTTNYPTSLTINDVTVNITDNDGVFEEIIDNLDSSKVTIVGDWDSNANVAGYFGSDYHHDKDAGQGSKSFTFTPSLPTTGTYEVFIQYSSSGNRASNVPVDIIHDGGTTTVTVDQTTGGGAFNSLGTFTFTASTGSVKIRTTSANGYVIADAVKFVESGPPAAAVSISESAGSTDVTEDGATDTYDIALATTPTGSVSVTVTADADSEVSLDGTNFASSKVLTFTTTTAQTVTVRAIDDAVDEGSHTATLTHAITTTNDATNYPTSMTIASVTVNITDNDGAYEEFIDNLDSSNVTIVGDWSSNANVAGYFGTDYHHDQDSGQGTKSFTFTPSLPTTGTYEVFIQYSSSGNRASNVPVDIIHDGGTTTVTVDQTTGGGAFNSLGTFTFTASTGSVKIRTTSANGYVIADAVKFVESGPASPGVSISESSGSTDITEGTGTDTYDVALNTTPAGSVTVTVTADAESEVSLDGTNFASSKVLTFTTTTAQTVTVRAIDDEANEGPHTSTITHAITATNDTTDYPTSMSINDVVANVTDDDAPYQEDIDNLDSSNVTIVGDWGSNANVSGYFGTDYHHDKDAGQGTKSFTFTPSLPTTGDYEVFMQWTSETNRASNVPVDIIHDGGTTTVTVDQTTGGGVMTSLGTYTFTASTGSVKIRTTSANGYVIADAVRFTEVLPVPGPMPEGDSGDTGSATVGNSGRTVDLPAQAVQFALPAGAKGQPFAATQSDAASLLAFDGVGLVSDAADASADADDRFAADLLALASDVWSSGSVARDAFTLEAFDDGLDLLGDLAVGPLMQL